jgi:hypothetical protein
MIAVGVVDRQPIPYPNFTGDQLAAYNVLSAAVTNNPKGIRSLYNTPGLDWGPIDQAIAATPRPADIPQADWDAVEQEISTEILDVATVYGRLGLIQALNTAIQAVNDGALNAAGQAAGLIVNGNNSNTTIRIVLEDLFEAVAGAISDIGIPPAGAVIASLLASGLSDGISYYESQNNDTPGQAIPIAFNQLQAALDTIFVQSLNSLNTDTSKIVTDYGNVTAVAQAILNGQWPYVNQTSSQIAGSAIHAFGVYFYQVLTAAGWQVVYTKYGNDIEYPINQILQVPSYDLYQVPLGYGDGFPVEEAYFSNQLGDTIDLDDAPNLGSYPGAPLINNIQALGAGSYNDFWTGQNGWMVIKHYKGTGTVS